MDFFYGNQTMRENVTRWAIPAFRKTNEIFIPSTLSFNKIFGDPLPGHRKTLLIHFTDDNTTLELAENRARDYTLHAKIQEKFVRTTSLNLCALLKVDKIFLLNLPTRTDRLEQSAREFEKLCIGKDQWERFEAYRGSDPCVQEKFKNLYQDYCKNQPITRATQGAFACLIGHYSMIAEAKKRGYKRIMILEDDFEPTESFDNERIFEKIGALDFDLFYFSTTTMAPPLPTPDVDFVKVQRAYAACAYIVNNSLYDVIINQSLVYAKQIDVFYADVIQKQFKVYSLPKSVILQREGFSDIEQTHVKYEFSH